MAVQPLEFETPIFELEKKIDELKNMSSLSDQDMKHELNSLEKKLEKVKSNIYKSLTAPQKVLVARHPQRPYLLDYIKMLFTDFVELHGDRNFRDDPAIIGGMAKFEGEPVVIVGHQKGRNTKENIHRNFGMAHPEGYRKALRIFEMAEKYNRPIISFIDTPGAFPGIGAEERGQAEAIARNLKEMAGLTVPFISVISGEGGSGGALGIAMGNRVLMLEHSIYAVISPEGCASILWKDASYSGKAAEALKLTAQDLKKLNVIDEIIQEPLGGAHRDYITTAENVRQALIKHLGELKQLSPERLFEYRCEKYMAMGVFAEQ
ncbi:Acetyl-coenzyme A carboxylase carboxyl transferase subunit alpha [Flexistipes sinusarabici DSM 4947]|uniref:Acetyl-coenzyme A carboxylase carboxyl transferase subunit alpha n=4 Tax=Flexistipes sinusarabici TaxID=2352 RepID=F8E5R1_FLESM|nr:acetyl-CoA carboxylase carboxyltransferase subunit alpha [Flexistipes sinusarabici]AEI14692.1 Acetyl-coenzyme A carboxylase carboxyl transferase subunit alpha [Flexistipes sinusarabici DSM 4947]